MCKLPAVQARVRDTWLCECDREREVGMRWHVCFNPERDYVLRWGCQMWLLCADVCDSTPLPFIPQWMKYLRGAILTYFNVCCSHNTGINHERQSFISRTYSVHISLYRHGPCSIVTCSLYAAGSQPCIFRLFILCLRYKSPVVFCRQLAGRLPISELCCDSCSFGTFSDSWS